MPERLKLPVDGTRVEGMTYESVEYDRDPEKVTGLLSTRETAWGPPPHCYVDGMPVQPETVKALSKE